MNKLLIIGSPSCQPCKDLKSKLDAAGVAYTYVDITNPHAPHFDEARALMDTEGLRSVPAAFYADTFRGVGDEIDVEALPKGSSSLES